MQWPEENLKQKGVMAALTSKTMSKTPSVAKLANDHQDDAEAQQDLQTGTTEDNDNLFSLENDRGAKQKKQTSVLTKSKQYRQDLERYLASIIHDEDRAQEFLRGIKELKRKKRGW
jgi:hypothetical protein